MENDTRLVLHSVSSFLRENSDLFVRSGICLVSVLWGTGLK